MFFNSNFLWKSLSTCTVQRMGFHSYEIYSNLPRQNKDKYDFSMIDITSGQPVLRMEGLRGCPSPPPSTEVITFSCKSASWLLITLYIGLLILSTLTVDLPPLPSGSTEAITFSHKSESWLLILSTLTVDLSTLTVDPFYIDYWSSPHWLLIYLPSPLDQQRRSPFHAKSESWLLILSMSIIDPAPPPRIQQCWSPLYWLLILPGSTVDRPRPYRFQLSNL